ncbi:MULTISPECIES: LLM class oxidoreductase [Photorhabdus]|uniref:LLM class oxidoreductase n=1 Tax=Photorhabdus TaxID=29487 RepID=UPI000DCCCDE7|nr:MULTISPECIES: LLM class oxidoreductase [Photorhabdus]MCT8344173.1 LLM class oxidoreductase [Photorhabdus kleinii]RAW95609.1 LLM class flavin-dependent oxidoreductase [Photorhabdus sp. S9-53]RAW96027.1 LLM class flavin-dependent oxidoreductase [Photorhabdus sp. S10-54]RAX00020.1 LLM class flavin-dependent oxidoreductase [Photorhabdus sp. S8-52]
MFNYSKHKTYTNLFKENKISIGMFLPLRALNQESDITPEIDLIREIEQQNFSAIWLRDIPLFDPNFGDIGQGFDPFIYAAWLAALTSKIAIGFGSAIFTLRHPIDLAKKATSIDQLSNGRLILGVAAGDRMSEFPAYNIPYNEKGMRFVESINMFRALLDNNHRTINSPLGYIDGNLRLIPKAVNDFIPLIVTGRGQQDIKWIAENSDGWFTYPIQTHNKEGVARLGKNISEFRQNIPGNMFKPHLTNEWIDLVEDKHYPRTPTNGGFILKTGRLGLIELLEEWQEVGVNHAALGIQYGKRPSKEVIQEIGEEVLPAFV